MPPRLFLWGRTPKLPCRAQHKWVKTLLRNRPAPQLAGKSLSTDKLFQVGKLLDHAKVLLVLLYIFTDLLDFGAF